ncbi:hypothetical protein ACQKDA_09675 [Psychrobacter sp. NPDC078370]|nr:hypothetical protein [Psychrobacter sp. MES7-P7E]PLT21458.1 hypothetical protein CXF62_10000 [Psychrobacter sp. MES7-P7E]|tara:strand:- start:188 stop:376 length:189 start_codon:yes stop_codon:yes gene_type:complete
MKILIALLVVSLLVGCEGNNSSNSIQQESKIVEAQPASRPSSGVYEERLGGQDSIAPLEIKT